MNLKVFTAFSGYDSQCMALDRLHRHNPDFNYELVGWAEIDKYAIAAHNAVYPQWAQRNYGDISKIDWAQVPDFDLFTYSSPCQDFSQAGKQAGGTEGSGTRSSLLWECRRAILAKKPKYLLMENVAALVSQKFIRLFNAWQLELESYGYRNFAKVLNAKDYGVPQNRERIFMVSVLDEQARYEFPDPMPLPLRLKDVLEPKVDERYYLKCETIEGIMPKETEPLNEYEEGIARTIKAQYMQTSRANFIRHDGLAATGVVTPVEHIPGIIIMGEVNKGTSGLVYHQDGISPTITASEGVKYNTKITEPACKVLGNIYESQGQNGDIFDTSGLSPALRSGQGVKGRGIGSNNAPKIAECSYRIRKLTERECFRLMDVPEEYIDRIQAAGISRSQQYKMAGNSIVVSCMYHIWRKLWIDTQIKTLTLF